MLLAAYLPAVSLQARRLLSPTLTRAVASARLVDPPHPAVLPVKDLERDLKVSFTKGSGPGGQNRNKVQTAVVLEHVPTGVRGSAADSRSQQQNRAAALYRLRVKLALELRTALALDAPTTELWARRRKGTKVVCNEKHEDFPALLAEALNHVEASENVGAAAERLGVSTNNLVALLKQARGGLGAVDVEKLPKWARPKGNEPKE